MCYSCTSNKELGKPQIHFYDFPNMVQKMLPWTWYQCMCVACICTGLQLIVAREYNKDRKFFVVRNNSYTTNKTFVCIEKVFLLFSCNG